MEEKNIPKAEGFQVDGVLVALIKQAEDNYKDETVPKDKTHLNIILTVGGILVAGEMIGHDQWFDEQFPADSTDEDQPSEESAEPSEAKRTYVHLRDARFYQGNQVIPAQGAGFFWRGRLLAVDGFMLGGLETISRKQEPYTIDVAGTKIRIGHEEAE